ncbi:MAG TPA: aldo/keto reductase [Povalibacter sp.]|uniref:aldo/keto reductase n=1 Tax=Povalibacter sp. TaxID=1962978 RepID=UPI002C3681FD|nr:aldo/keto reductase [Povalibacter sp.]HMN46876.1 aldo/keto reductase [Povalibacter sp.]
MSVQLDHYRLLGRSGLRVSPLSLGTMTFGVAQGWGSTPADAEAIFNLYAERGGNFIDTANFYASGDSERTLAGLVRGRRNRFVIATKYSLTMRPGDPNASGNHRKNMMQSVEDSLQRLGTDYIDLLYLHVWDSRTPVEEILRAFDDLVRAGKVLYVGVSDLPAWQASRMQAIAELRGWSPLVALQIPYSLIERTVERELMPMALEMGMGVMPWSPLGGGVLTGKYQATDLKPSAPGATMDSRKNINVATGRLSERSLAIAAVVSTIAQELSRTPAQVALAWTLLNPSVTSPILGARTLAQFEDNLGALEIRFSDDQVARLNSVSHVEPGFPQTMLQGLAMDMMFGGVKVARRSV